MWEISLQFNIFVSIETLEYELHSKKDFMWCGTAVSPAPDAEFSNEKVVLSNYLLNNWILKEVLLMGV